MKSKLLNTIFIFVLSFFAVGNSYAQLLLKDNFEYAVGDSLCGQPTWDWMNVPATRNLIMIQSGALTYADYPSSNIGNKVALTTSGEDLYRTFPRQITGSVYASFLVKVTALPSTTGDYFFAFTSNPSNKTIFHGRVYVKKDASGNLAFGVVRSATSGTGWTSAIYSLNTTYLVVIKYEIIAGATNDMCSIIVNPTIATEPAAGSWTFITGNANAEDAALVGGIALRQGSTGAPVVEISGIRVATSWADLMNPSATVTGLVLNTDDGIKTGFSATTARQSTEQSFKISGSNITNNVVFTQIGTTKYFELSTDNSTYSNEITLTPVDGTLPETTVYIRMKSNSVAASYSNSFTISSTGTNTTYFKASGTVTVTTAVDNNLLSMPTIKVVNGVLELSGLNKNEVIEVVNLIGQKVYTAVSGESVCRIPLSVKGIHVVKTGKISTKIIL